MRKENVYRSFIEAIIRLRRDQVNISAKNIFAELELKLTDADVIKFDSSTKFWKVSSKRAGIENVQWNPIISEIVKFIKQFNDDEILSSIEKLKQQTIEIFSKTDAMQLLSKFNLVLLLLKDEKNYYKNIAFENFTIYWDFELNNYMLFKKNKTFIIDIDKEIPQLLKTLDYQTILNSLEDCYKSLYKIEKAS